MPIPEKSPLSQYRSFATTCWSEVRRAARMSGEERESLQHLCEAYWYPLYAYLRRSGHGPDQAQDYVQSFFVDLLSRNSLQAADPQRGRFRSFLLTACRNHVSNLQRADRAIVRGGGLRRVPMQTATGEQLYAAELVEKWTPQKLYDRRWALAVIDRALARVRGAYQDKGRADRFDALCPLIAPSATPPTHAELAKQLQCSVGSIKVAAHRLRQQFSAALREEIAATVDIEAGQSEVNAIDDELRILLQALRGD